MRESLRKFEYRRLGAFTYQVLAKPSVVKRQLLRWIMAEWARDHAEALDEPWTVEWMARLPHMQFSLQQVSVADIRPRPDLMAHHRPGYSFAAELEARLQEREEAVQRGCSIEPLLIDAQTMELMDGYVRYRLLCAHRQRLAYAYVGMEGRRQPRPKRRESDGRDDD